MVSSVSPMQNLAIEEPSSISMRAWDLWVASELIFAPSFMFHAPWDICIARKCRCPLISPAFLPHALLLPRSRDILQLPIDRLG